MHFSHPASKLFCEITATQMNVECRCLDVSMSGERCDFVNVPVRSRWIGQTEMPQRMGSEPGQLAFAGYPRDYLGPRPDRNRFPLIPIRLRQEQRTAFSAQ